MRITANAKTQNTTRLNFEKWSESHFIGRLLDFCFPGPLSRLSRLLSRLSRLESTLTSDSTSGKFDRPTRSISESNYKQNRSSTVPIHSTLGITSS